MAPQQTRPENGLRGRRPWLPAISLLLYFLSFPNPLATGGLGLLSLVALAPLFAWLDGMRPGAAGAAGAAWGALAYAGISYWLGNYHPGALVLSCLVAAAWFALGFAAVSLASRLPAWISALSVPVLWSALECARSSGMLAFPYGTLPYALYRWEAPLALASAGGAALVGLWLAAVNSTAARALKALLARHEPPAGAPRRPPAALAWLLPLGLSLAALLAFGPPAQTDALSAVPLESAGDAAPEGRYRVALVQPNLPRQSGVKDYRHSLAVLTELSDRARSASPDLLAWHETAVIPPIEWYARHRTDRDTYEVCAAAGAYLRSYPAAALIGNGWADPDDPEKRIQGNGAVLYDGNLPYRHYEKVKLVPFSEYYPLGDALPGLSRWLVAAFGYFWTPGPGPSVMEAREARVAAPICFEDSFGPYIASFDRPDFFVVLTDDSWGRSAALQEQHLSMSAYRAAETAAIVLRVANSGATAAIGPNGAVAGRLPPFRPDTLIADLELGTTRLTGYERWGWRLQGIILAAGAMLLVLAVAAALMGGPFRVDKKRRV